MNRILSFSFLTALFLMGTVALIVTTTAANAYAQSDNNKEQDQKEQKKTKVYAFCWFDPLRPTATGCIHESSKESCESELQRLEPANPQFVYDDKCHKV